ncbi:hypothetical protein [Vibrio barjaei]|uniref:hypothetical protein n=1 Tax=Vibrio barjaei TaxID=1676683 RepID=UPI002283C68F|nr:hypothetical protein [Vibrio barjaei]MCY9870509.1 hypothetical protein [Vibrio barjaei]
MQKSFTIPEYLFNKDLTIDLVGCGGTGSEVALNLFQMFRTLKALDPHMNITLNLWDESIVTKANLVRQPFFETQVGMRKDLALAWTAINLHGLENVYAKGHYKDSNFLSGNIFITALDRPSIRQALYERHIHHCKNALWLDIGNDDHDGQAVLGEFNKKAEWRLPTICDLYDLSGFSDEEALKKSCSAEESLNRQDLGVNAMGARIGTQILWNLLRHGTIDTHGAFFDVRRLSCSEIEIGGIEWDAFGYDPINHLPPEPNKEEKEAVEAES